MDAYENDPPRPGRLAQLLLPLFLIFVGVPAAASLYVEMRWFHELGHAEIFTTVLSAETIVGTLLALLAGIVVLVNLRLAAALSRGLAPLYLHDPDGVARVNLGDVAARLMWPVSIGIGVLTGLFNYRHWDRALLFLNGVPFGTTDPIFGRDVGFYVFSLPAYNTMAAIALWIVGITAAATFATYIARGAAAVSEVEQRIHPAARVHLSVLGALVLSLLALQSYLDMFDVLYSKVTQLTGASYADVHAKLPALRIKVALAGVAAVLVLASATRENFNLVIGGLVLFAGAHFGAIFYPDMVHRFSVVPNELEKEAPFLQNNIEATRAAYGLDAVVERDLTGRDALSIDDIENNAATIDNIRLWDQQPLLDTFSQIQEIRTYYDFVSVDHDRYVIDGKLRQTMLSPRELSVASLQTRTWINEFFTYTHGYGLTLGPVNETSPEGLPVLFVQDLPPVSSIPKLQITQPAIYFGELSSDTVFVRTRNREFDYPSGDADVETDYDGEAGLRFDSTLMRLALAVKMGEIKLLLTNDIDSDSRALLHRNITGRLSRVAPFLSRDPDPYMVVRDDGTLAWIYDTYTVSDRYPYSQRSPGGLNYVRNSVKAVIDAYHGSVTLYVADDSDPLIQAWKRIFPNTFADLSEMPADLRRHLRYPEGIFKLQTEMFATYHMSDAQTLYKREDQWEVPAITQTDQKAPMEPYYTVMKLPGERDAEFIQMLPFTPRLKDNLAAWMVARSDGDALGELVVYRFPKNRLVFGPEQVVNRINQDAEISRQISLWDQRGSQAVFGTLLVIPIEESLIYVRPLYLRSEGGKIPELKRVIVAYEKRIAMKPSLREAMNAIFDVPVEETEGPTQAEAPPDRGTETDQPAQPAPDEAAASAVANNAGQPAAAGTGAAPAAEALQRFERAVAAQRRGDWATYGAELEAVERLLRRMQPDSKPAPTPAP